MNAGYSATDKRPNLLERYTTGFQWPFFEDAALIGKVQSSVYIMGGAKNFAQVATCQNIRSLALREISQAQLDGVGGMGGVEDLRIYGFRGTDLSPLLKMRNLRIVSLTWAPKLEDIHVLGRLDSLHLLVVGLFKRVDDFSALAKLKKLRALSIENGMSGKQACKSLRPIGEMTQLEELWLQGVRVADGDLRPLARLQRLRELRLANWYPVREFAWLSVALPHTQCDRFGPTSPMPPGTTFDLKSGKFVADPSMPDVMLTGSPLKAVKLTDARGADMAAKRAKEFERWREIFRRDPGSTVQTLDAGSGPKPKKPIKGPAAK